MYEPPAEENAIPPAEEDDNSVELSDDENIFNQSNSIAGPAPSSEIGESASLPVAVAQNE